MHTRQELYHDATSSHFYFLFGDRLLLIAQAGLELVILWCQRFRPHATFKLQRILLAVMPRINLQSQMCTCTLEILKSPGRLPLSFPYDPSVPACSEQGLRQCTRPQERLTTSS